ncbi:MAG: mechanosensitive ion channel family protein [Syntrophales bacterium]|nr:mechanosensitive ion channel family protein [Syntrophales bacterium]
MDVIFSTGEYLVRLFEGLIAGNEPWNFVVSGIILVFGFILMEFIWRRALLRIEKIQELRMVKRWSAYLSAFAPSIRLVVAVLLLRIAQMPLVLPEGISLLLGGLESFLIAVAIILFVFQLVQILDLLYLTIMPSAAPVEGAEEIPDDKKLPSAGVMKDLKGIFRILGILCGAIFFVYTQQEIFPSWVWQSPWWRYGLLVGIFSVIYTGGKMLLDFLRALTNSLRDAADQVQLRLVVESTLWPIRLILLAMAIYVTKEMFDFPEALTQVSDTAISVIAALVVFVFLYKLLAVIEYELTRFVKREDNELDMNFVQMARIVLKVLVVVFGFIYLVKAATGQPMTSLLAGLGIGGLAVALAAQDTLKNLFGSFMLMIDKPFVVGDWIQVDGTHAIVEEIGFRSTKVRTFTGHLLYIPNEHMASITIENVRKRPFVRRNMNVTITYDTPPDKVGKAVDMIREILSEEKSELHPDYPTRVHFNDFNDTSLNIIVAYWYRENDHWAAVAFGEKINFAIMRAFEREGIEFAFPTSTTYLAQDERRPLTIALRNESEAAVTDGKGSGNQDIF